MSKRDIRLFLKDILEAINKTQRFVSGKTFEDFQNDDLLIDGVTRNLEVIGEAAKQIPEDFRSRHKEVNWTQVVGFRSRFKCKTFNPIRREGEIVLQLPEKSEPIHYIETDDPSGIESYWHRRFADKRKEGEWFALSTEDIRAFKRWRRIH